jgi:glutathione S-transferase
MLTLHGFAFSNYFNIVKHVLLYKGIPFEDNTVYPHMPELLAVNPTGKVPALTTEEGTHLAETSVLVDYLEETYPQMSLYPANPDARATVRQLMKISELYLDLPARRLLPALFGKAEIPQPIKEEVQATLAVGARSVGAMAQFTPFVLGETMTLADIYLRYALAIPKLVGPGQLGWNVLEAVPGLAAWDGMMAESDIARRIDQDMRDNSSDFMAFIASRQR